MEWLMKLLDPVQLIGYMGMCCAFVSYQCKRNQMYFFFQTMCAVCFTVQFILLGSWSAVFMNVFSILRGGIFFLGDRCRKAVYFWIMEICFVLSSVLSVVVFQELWWIAILLLVAQAGGTLAMWTRNGKTIRIAQLSMISPIWIVNNVFYFSIGGILCEVFNMLSVVISMLRFRKTGYDEN